MTLARAPPHFRERFVRSFLDWVMLSILARKPTYGYELIEIIAKEFGVYVSPGSLYPILYSMERTGLITGAWDNPNRRSRKIYRLTSEGHDSYEHGLGTLGGVVDSFRRKKKRNPST